MVYFKIFYDRDNGEGQLTYQQVLDQVAWLNNAFHAGQGGAGTRFDFVLGAYNNIPVARRTVDLRGGMYGDFSNFRSDRTKDLMRTHHDGGLQTLNVYVADLQRDGVGPADQNVYGPWGLSSDPRVASSHPKLDGIWVDRGAFLGTPGDGVRYFGQGDNLVHETGHWLGLYHTANVPELGCFHNFMSYGSDRCRDRFAQGQADRMSTIWDTYRA